MDNKKRLVVIGDKVQNELNKECILPTCANDGVKERIFYFDTSTSRSDHIKKLTLCNHEGVTKTLEIDEYIIPNAFKIPHELL